MKITHDEFHFIVLYLGMRLTEEHIERMHMFLSWDDMDHLSVEEYIYSNCEYIRRYSSP